MRFSGRDANRIAAGRKTEHRLPRFGETERGEVGGFAGRTVPVTVMLSNPDLGYSRRNRSRPRKEGHTVCHVRVLEVEAGLLHEAGELGARAEGHNGFEELVNTWWGRYKTGCGLPGSPEFPIEIPVWVVRFELDTAHRPRLLARASDVNRGYTESPAAAVADAGEAVEDAYLDRFAADAQEAHEGRRQTTNRDRENLDMEARIAAYQREARLRHIDIRSELRAVRKLKGHAQVQQARAIRRRLDDNGMDRAA